MSKDKSALQLGMNRSTASNRLVKDLLYKFAVEGTPCYRCGEELTRETFSIEHKEVWLDSDDPVGTFFDLDNISFSHKSCNSAAGRKPPRQTSHGTSAMYHRGQCRCDECRDYEVASKARNYSKEGRRKTYLKTGK